MTTLVHLPSFACEHITKETIDKISTARSSAKSTIDPDFVQYACISCPTTGSFSNLDKHFQKTKHEFAVTPESIYCGRCNDLVYEPSFMKAVTRKRKLAQLSEEDESYLSSNTAPKPCGREGVRGLFNLGETCYMNAVLQMMVHNPILANYFLGMGHPLHTCPISKEPEKKNDSDDSDDENGDEKEQKTCVSCAMTELFSDTNLIDQTTPAHAVNLLFASWKHIPAMSGKSQQDAQEWYTIIIDKLHDSAVNPSQAPALKHQTQTDHCKCFFHKVFYGRFYSDVTCDTCHNVTTTESEYSSIGLDFQKQKKRKKKQMKEGNASTEGISTKDKDKSKNSQASAAIVPIPNLSECLRAYTTSEPLDEEIDCGTCGTKRNAHKGLRVRKLPAILTMHVKRFGLKKTNNVVIPEKYEGKLDFPLTLDMGPYTLSPGAGVTNGTSTTVSPTKKTKDKDKDKDKDKVNGTANQHNSSFSSRTQDHYIYDLDSVVVHQGDHAHTGHYYAFCRQGGRWYRYDDEIVSATTTEDVMRQEAYLLFYGLRDISGGGEVSNDVDGAD